MVNRFEQKLFNTVCTLLDIINDNSAFLSPIYTFSLARNIIAYTPTQGTKREKYLNRMKYKGKKCQLWWEMNTFP